MINWLIQAICWTLIHSLWQGLLLTMVAGIVMLLTKKARAVVRYTLLIVLFFIFLAVCGYTFMYECNSAYAAGGTLMAGALPVTYVLQQYGMGDLPAVWMQYCSDHAMFIVTGWFMIFSFRCWQMGRALLYIRRISVTRFQDPGSYWSNKLNTLAQQLNIQKKVRLLESGVTRVPVVIGHLKPVIYMPLGLLANLPPDQVEAVLLHELAHIRRHDFLVNLLQNIAETIFFFNPGLLWVSSLLKQEREHCCDDMALHHTRKKKQFIEALISFREHAVYGARYATAFPGNKNQLLQRVTRIIQNRNNSLSAPEKIFFLFSFLLFAVLLVAAGHKPMPVNNTTPDRQPYIVASKVGSTTTVQQIKQVITITKKPVQKACNEKHKPQQEPAGEDRALVSNQHQETYLVPEPLPAMVYQQPASTSSNLEGLAGHSSQAKPSRFTSGVDLPADVKAHEQAELDRQQADRDRAQAEQDRIQADKDRAQAELDRQQAEKDRQQAVKDRAQAEQDKKQAEVDRRQAEKDRQQAIKDREQFERDRIAYAQKKAAH